MLELLTLFVRVLPTLLEIIKMIQQNRLSAQATDEMLADLEQTADYLVTRSKLARAEVKDAPSDIDSDPYNRD